MKRGWMRDETAEAWLAGLVWRLCAMAKRDVDRTARHPEEAVHALRVRMKKLQALLRLGLAEGVDLSGMDAHCRAILKGVSVARDEAVMRKLYWKLFDKAPAWQGERVAKGWSVAKLRREVARLTRLAACTSFSALTWESVRANYALCLKRAQKALKRCEAADDAACFHRLRKRVKALLFQSLALPESRGVRKRIRRAKALGKRLGHEHDLAVLEAKLAALGDHPERLAQVERRRLRMHERLREEGAKLLRR